MNEHAVVIAGGGPTGLMLAGELALARVDVAIVERRENQEVPGRRAGGLHARTIELLDQRGIADRFLSQGTVMQVAGFALNRLDISDFPTRHNYGLALRQEAIERFRPNQRGVNAIGKLEDGERRAGLVVNEPEVRQGDQPTLAELREALVAVYGTDFGVRDVTYLSRFTDAARQAASYRERRVLLAGDAAHVHSPAGGQGLNTGVHDAVNLGWKLAQVVRGASPDCLLDTYQAERHPIGARVLQLTMAQTALMRGDDRTKAAHAMLSELLEMDEPRKRYAAIMSGLDIHHDLGPGHPLLGRRMPDLDLETDGGPRRVFALLHRARPVLLDLGGPGALDIAPWADRVDRVEARYEGAWELPVLGAVTAPAAVLIRPDGHVAWVGDGGDHGLRDALTTWFGPPSR